MIKPDLTSYFISMPIIGMWMLTDYNKANTIEELTSLMHKWFDVSNTTKNTTKKNCYTSGAYYLYSLLNKKSFESIINI